MIRVWWEQYVGISRYEESITRQSKNCFRGFKGFTVERVLQTCVVLSLVLAQQI